MLLAIDIGNTNVVFGIYVQDEWKDVWRLKTKDETQQVLIKNIMKHLNGVALEHVVISSVVPMFTPIIRDQVEHHFKVKAHIIGPESYPKLPIKILNPKQIGTDLVADAVGAYDKFKSDCLVVDFGTALTFTLIVDNQIKGVNIAPGLKTAMNALTQNTAKLRDIPLELPNSAIGTDTASAIQSGILWGYVGLVEKMIERIEKEIGKELKIVATGGLSKVLEPLENQFDEVDGNLTLSGMRLIYDFNHKQNG